MKTKFYSFLALALISLQACQKSANTSGFSPGSSQGYSGGTGGGTGQGGSLARFTIARNHLYVVDNQQLYTYSLANSEQPAVKSQVQVGFNVETIYSYEDKLFIGSQSAMYIYSIADAAAPKLLGTATHVRACDPVVANDSLAYVTIRTGTNCGGTVNALLIYNVRNVLNPTRLNTIPMTNPTGLGIRNKTLYVCDGAAGLVVYDLADPVYPKVIQQVKGDTYQDVIATNNVLLAMVQNGTMLFTYGANDTLTVASRIAN